MTPPAELVEEITEELVTLDEYLAAEETALEKHEYWAGRVFTMSGGTPRHADLIANVTIALGSRLRGHRCRGSSSDQRIRIEETDVEFYPDFVVKCPPEKYSDLDRHALINPVLVVEVLSPGTEKSDRAEKFEQYSLIPELRDYILVSQDRIAVEHFRRSNGEEWILRRYASRDDKLALSNLDIEVPLDEIYEGLELPNSLKLFKSHR